MKNKTVLYVEDDPDDVELFTTIFGQQKHDLDLAIAANGDEAKKILNDMTGSLPCFIVVDINMPKMNGIELLEWIKEGTKFRKVEMILISTTTNPLYEEIANSHGVPYYQKPVTIIDLTSFISNIVSYCEAL